MPEMLISEIAELAGIRPSAIRYYEQIGILVPARRVSGQRRYDHAVLRRLAVVERARQCGFTLNEIQQLFSGFQENVSPSVRWRKLAQRKQSELDELIRHIRIMKRLISRWEENCRCMALDECGERLLSKRQGGSSRR